MPRNADATEFRLSVEVHPFELLSPMTEYSIYYPTYLEADSPAEGEYKFGDISDAQMLAEFRNMRAHVLSNPNIYDGPKVMPDGSLDFSNLDRVLDRREQAGLRPKVLYLISPEILGPYQPLTDKQQQQVNRRVADINSWVWARGCDEVHLAMHDES